jgi:hypothetical protein
VDPTSRPVLFVLVLLGLPALVGGSLLLAGRKLRGSPALGWTGALAFGVAYCAGHAVALLRWPGWPPASSNEALFYSGAVIALAAGLAAPARVPALGAAAIRGAGSLAACWLVLHRVLAREPQPRQLLLSFAVFVFAAMVTLRFERVAAAAKGASVPALLWIVAASTAAAIGATGSAEYAQYAACVAAFLGAAAVFGLLARDATFARGAADAALLQLYTIAFAAKLLSDLPLGALGSLIAAPWAAAVLFRPLEARWTERRLAAARFATVAVACGAALAIAYARHREQTLGAY